mmetsp:Transcript_65842/g.130517  ORF Transcript_65842/g.130517 Transcript_65842/m.130517 type:complete len:181 (-) Transcript_65842:193-735(-)
MAADRFPMIAVLLPLACVSGLSIDRPRLTSALRLRGGYGYNDVPKQDTMVCFNCKKTIGVQKTVMDGGVMCPFCGATNGRTDALHKETLALRQRVEQLTTKTSQLEQDYSALQRQRRTNEATSGTSRDPSPGPFLVFVALMGLALSRVQAHKDMPALLCLLLAFIGACLSGTDLFGITFS